MRPILKIFIFLMFSFFSVTTVRGHVRIYSVMEKNGLGGFKERNADLASLKLGGEYSKKDYGVWGHHQILHHSVFGSGSYSELAGIKHYNIFSMSGAYGQGSDGRLKANRFYQVELLKSFLDYTITPYMSYSREEYLSDGHSFFHYYKLGVVTHQSMNFSWNFYLSLILNTPHSLPRKTGPLVGAVGTYHGDQWDLEASVVGSCLSRTALCGQKTRREISYEFLTTLLLKINSTFNFKTFLRSSRQVAHFHRWDLGLGPELNF